MADILIRGMEMPEHCGYCRFRYDGICHALQKTQYRMEDCPLIALPEGHGPLIDADKLMRHYAWWGECEQKELFDSIVEQQDTIVPAEKEDV